MHPNRTSTCANNRVVRNSRIARQLPRTCQRNGLQTRRVVLVTAVFRDVAEADRILGLQRVTAKAVEGGHVSADSAQSWLHHRRSQPSFASACLFVAVATPAT